MNVVTHIELNQPGNRRSGIRKVHGRTGANSWAFTETEAIAMILGTAGTTYEFWVVGAAPSPARVVVAGTHPQRFLKTEADGIGQNNLLFLPEWPHAAWPQRSVEGKRRSP